MHQFQVLIHQPRPFHQIVLHQAFNAQGVYSVRLTEDMPGTLACLNQERPVDVLVLDHDMPISSAQSLFRHLAIEGAAQALLFVGQGKGNGPDLAREARKLGLWVLDELAWPMSTVALGKALGRLPAPIG
ncbi:histidine kinase [Pseudomonas sichuanensis]|uniref:Histidine kinase n=1 Tax=Pseudomonas sichuanensis TaxID=2213015 RepID=A0ABV0DAE6_9PSED